MSAGVEMKGLEEFARKLGVAVERLAQSAAAAAQVAGGELAELAQRGVPVETGRLRDSAYVTEPAVERGKLMVEIGYGAPYAAIVHEREREPWFLEAINAYSMQVRDRFVATMRAGLAGSLPSVGARFPTRPRIETVQPSVMVGPMRSPKRWRKSIRTKRAQKTRTTYLRRTRAR